MLGRKVGEGGNSEVFEWGDHKVIKLAKPNTKLETLQREYSNTLALWKLGLSVPKVYEIIEVNQRPGIVFEQIHGETQKDRLFKSILEETIEEQPKVWNDIRSTARLLSEIHRLSLDDLPEQRGSLKYQIGSVDYLSEEEKETVIHILDSLPLKNNICHGDPNPNNVLVENETSIMIDWNDTTSGNPEADIAEYLLMIRFAVLPPDTPQPIISYFDNIREEIMHVFMVEYTKHTGTTLKDIEPWIIPIAARKLSASAISEEEKKILVNEIRSRLKNRIE